MTDVDQGSPEGGGVMRDRGVISGDERCRIQVLFGDRVVGVRYRGQLRGPVMLLTSQSWARFLRAVRRDEFFDFAVPEEFLARQRTPSIPERRGAYDPAEAPDAAEAGFGPAVLAGSVILGSARRGRFHTTTSAAPSTTPPMGSSAPVDRTGSPAGR
ncbi:putative DUF397 family protein [Actinoalloteichus hymeniacidonis]|uniref:DUF397 family protein n=1 Tax=Actinoalloteichus hymeniacidonis TaxID=340345 RepID=A0AAC9N050_9PSEU|nr:putative DUF397 family protein [Actinoalloteichus hymeniacidonis]